MFNVVSIGGATRDIFCKTCKGEIIENKKETLLAFEYGSKIIPDEAFFTYGGGAHNSSVCFARLGLKAAMVASIGKDGTGSAMVSDLQNLGVNTTFINKTLKNHTALGYIVVAGKDHIIFNYRGANDELVINNWRPLKKTDWFYVSSLTGKSDLLVPQIFNFAKIHKIKIAWNPGSVQLSEGYKKLADFLKETEILILNKEEAKDLVSSSGSKLDLNDEKSLLMELKSFGPKMVIVTCGNDGAYACDGFMEY